MLQLSNGAIHNTDDLTEVQHGQERYATDAATAQDQLEARLRAEAEAALAHHEGALATEAARTQAAAEGGPCETGAPPLRQSPNLRRELPATPA